MSWWCLERCGGTPETIQRTYEQIANHTDTLTAVSFERYNLGPDGSLVLNNLTNVGPWLQELGVETWPMVSSYPYPPEFILYMREVFSNPEPFIDQLVAEGKENGYTGWNIDWEPSVGGSSADAKPYADFLTLAANTLHQHDLKLSVDFATWSPIWNVTLLGETTVDYLLDMSTYTNSDESFLDGVQTAVDAIPLDMLGIGVMVTNAATGAFMPPNEIEWRLETIAAYDVPQVAIWMEPLLPFWFPMLEDFLAA